MHGHVTMQSGGRRQCLVIGPTRGLGLGLPQPLASLVVAGDVGWLPRLGSTPHRGPLALYADTAYQPPYCAALLKHDLVRQRLKALGFARPSDLPWGGILGVVDQLANVMPREQLGALDPDDQALLELIPGDWIWQLDGFRTFAEPVPCEGWFDLKKLEPELARKVELACGGG